MAFRFSYEAGLPPFCSQTLNHKELCNLLERNKITSIHTKYSYKQSEEMHTSTPLITIMPGKMYPSTPPPRISHRSGTAYLAFYFHGNNRWAWGRLGYLCKRSFYSKWCLVFGSHEQAPPDQPEVKDFTHDGDISNRNSSQVAPSRDRTRDLCITRSDPAHYLNHASKDKNVPLSPLKYNAHTPPHVFLTWRTAHLCINKE